MNDYSISGMTHGHSPYLKFLQRLAGSSLAALFPATCCQCGQLYKMPIGAVTYRPGAPIPELFNQLMSHHLCAACGRQFQGLISPLCVQCGQPFAASAGPDHLCGPCIVQPFPFQAARAAGLYEGPLRSAIHHFKYSGCDAMAKPFGRLLWRILTDHWDPGRIDCVIPVPLHGRRLRKRGFNQAHLLVREWPRLANREGVHVAPAWIDAGLLQRHRFTHSQTGLKKAERKANLRNAFSVVVRGRIQGKHILLVDDVFTTGATATACTQVLLKAGAAEVIVLTLARAVL